MAVRASAAVPGVFQPVSINGREYVDGGLVSPIPAKAVRNLGANFVIAVDISVKPRDARTASTLDVLLQTFAIMGQSISRYETAEADIVIRPDHRRAAGHRLRRPPPRRARRRKGGRRGDGGNQGPAGTTAQPPRRRSALNRSRFRLPVSPPAASCAPAP
jgi:predicted acylesterase/phospholipase RssA